MNSAEKINYELRPCKCVERKMFLASLSRIIGSIGQQYQYVGFGGLSFTDFVLFHKELNIESMYSIEGGGYTKEKMQCNKPFSCINILNGMSTDVLPSINLSDKPSIIWLDYDDALPYAPLFNDVTLIIPSIRVGSIIIISCNRELKNKENQPYSASEFRDIFGDIAPFKDVDDTTCKPGNAPKTIRKMIEIHCNKLINDRNRNSKDHLKLYPLYNIVYEEHRGARMYTYGGIFLDDKTDVQTLNIEDFDFINTENPYEIIVPKITHRESLLLNQVLGDEKKERGLIEKGIINTKQLEQYKKIYKYMPNFYDVRL